MHLLNLLIRIITAAITLTKEVRNLLSDFRHFKGYPMSIASNQTKPFTMVTLPEQVDMEEVQRNLEQLFHKNQLFPRIKAEFVSSPLQFRNIFERAGIPEAFGYDLLVQMVLHKRTKLPVLCAILRRHLNNNMQATADMILKAAYADLVDYQVQQDIFIVAYDITADVQHEIDLYQYPLPMIVKPKELKSNRDSGYLTSRDSIILRDNHHMDDVCLDHMDDINSTALSINLDVLKTIKNSWRNLEAPKPDEERSDYYKRVKAFEKYDSCSKEVMEHLVLHGNRFHLTHRYDKRGRVYCQGYHVNYQGNPWNKAVVEFADKEYLTE